MLSSSVLGMAVVLPSLVCGRLVVTVIPEEEFETVACGVSGVVDDDSGSCVPLIDAVIVVIGGCVTFVNVDPSVVTTVVVVLVERSLTSIVVIEVDGDWVPDTVVEC